ncbi:U-box domain containing protein, partial [Aphelenchoides avenae]
MCMECALCDSAVLGETLQFATKQLSFLINSINPNYMNDFKVPEDVPDLYGMYPEAYLETVLDFLVFLLKTRPKVLFDSRLELPKQLMIFICNTHYVKNPFLAAKVVEVVFMLCPQISGPDGQSVFTSMIYTPLAREKLFLGLVKFYADVEQTGAHTEFYDKFNIRREIQVIFKELRGDVLYRHKMVKMLAACPPDFVRFINMVINDATFLLDESLGALKQIHDIEALMENQGEWNRLPQEERQMKSNQLTEAQRRVKPWLILGDETMELFTYLSQHAPKAFCKHAFGDRVASMLNHNVIQLCGPKCSELNVKDAVSRFHWDPRRLLEKIVDVYLNLTSDEFANCIAHDEVRFLDFMLAFSHSCLALLYAGNDECSGGEAPQDSVDQQGGEVQEPHGRCREHLQAEDQGRGGLWRRYPGRIQGPTDGHADHGSGASPVGPRHGPQDHHASLAQQSDGPVLASGAQRGGASA